MWWILVAGAQSQAMRTSWITEMLILACIHGHVPGMLRAGPYASATPSAGFPPGPAGALQQREVQALVWQALGPLIPPILLMPTRARAAVPVGGPAAFASGAVAARCKIRVQTPEPP